MYGLFCCRYMDEVFVVLFPVVRLAFVCSPHSFVYSVDLVCVQCVCARVCARVRLHSTKQLNTMFGYERESERAEEGRAYVHIDVCVSVHIDNRTNIRCSSMHSNSIELESIMGMMLTLLLSTNSSLSQIERLLLLQPLHSHIVI